MPLLSITASFAGPRNNFEHYFHTTFGEKNITWLDMNSYLLFTDKSPAEVLKKMVDDKAIDLTVDTASIFTLSLPFELSTLPRSIDRHLLQSRIYRTLTDELLQKK